MDIIKEKFKNESIVYKDSIVLYNSVVAQDVVRACLQHDKEIYRLEAFLIREKGGIQPCMEFSRIYEGVAPKTAANQAIEFLKEMIEQPYLFEIMYA